MRILIVDPFGECVLDWALRCQADGHEVRWFLPPSDRTKPIGKGLVEKVEDFRPWMRWADLVFMTDNVKYLRDMDAWRKAGVKIVGPSQEAAAWELDRKLGMTVLERHGIEVPAYREFSDYDKAIAYVKRQDRPFVSKPCGDETDKSLSYVASSPADLVYMLERWKKQGKLKGRFILQEKVEGVEMGAARWFGPGGFNAGYEESFEHKKLFPGNLGPATGEMGSVLRYVRHSRLGRHGLDPLEGALDRLGYLGCVAVNFIIDAKGKPWPLEFTMRAGWPAFLIHQALHRGDHAQWLLDLAEGRDAKAWRYDEIAIGVVMALPDFPYSHATKKEVVGVPIYGVSPTIIDAVHPCQVMLDDAPMTRAGSVVTRPTWCSAGDYLLVATGTGASVQAARRRVYRALGRLKATPGSPFWRIDIGQGLKTALPAIQQHGYATGMEYSDAP